MLSEQLKQMLELNQENSAQDTEIIKNMIEKIKHKYQVKRGVITQPLSMHIREAPTSDEEPTKLKSSKKDERIEIAIEFYTSQL